MAIGTTDDVVSLSTCYTASQSRGRTTRTIKLRCLPFSSMTEVHETQCSLLRLRFLVHRELDNVAMAPDNRWP